MVDPASLHCGLFLSSISSHLPSGHLACLVCLTKVLASTDSCPICRSKIPPSFSPLLDKSLKNEILKRFCEDLDYMKRIEEETQIEKVMHCPHGSFLQSKTLTFRSCQIKGGCHSLSKTCGTSNFWECSGCGIGLCSDCFNDMVGIARSKDLQTLLKFRAQKRELDHPTIKFFPPEVRLNCVPRESDIPSDNFERLNIINHFLEAFSSTHDEGSISMTNIFPYPSSVGSLTCSFSSSSSPLNRFKESILRMSQRHNSTIDDQTMSTLATNLVEFIDSTLKSAIKLSEKRFEMSKEKELSLECHDLLPSLVEKGYLVYGYGYHAFPPNLLSLKESLSIQMCFSSSIRNVCEKYSEDQQIDQNHSFLLTSDLIQSLQDMLLSFVTYLLNKVVGHSSMLSATDIHHVHEDDNLDTLSNSSLPLIFDLTLPSPSNPSVIFRLFNQPPRHTVCYDKSSFYNEKKSQSPALNSNSSSQGNKKYILVYRHDIESFLPQFCSPRICELIRTDYERMNQYLLDSKDTEKTIYHSILTNSLLTELQHLSHLSFSLSEILIFLKQIYSTHSDGSSVVFTLDAVLFLTVALEYLCLQLIHSSVLVAVPNLSSPDVTKSINSNKLQSPETSSRDGYLLCPSDLVQGLLSSHELSLVFPGIVCDSKVASISLLSSVRNTVRTLTPIPSAVEFYQYLSVLVQDSPEKTLIDPYTGFHISFENTLDNSSSIRLSSLGIRSAYGFIWRPELDLLCSISDPDQRADLAKDLLPRKGKSLLSELKSTSSTTMSIKQFRNTLFDDYNFSSLNLSSFLSLLSTIVTSSQLVPSLSPSPGPGVSVKWSVEMVTCFYHLTEFHLSKLLQNLDETQPTPAPAQDTTPLSNFISIYANHSDASALASLNHSLSPITAILIALRPVSFCSHHHPLLSPVTSSSSSPLSSQQTTWWQCFSIPENISHCRQRVSIFYPPDQQKSFTCVLNCERYCPSCFEYKLQHGTSWIRIPLSSTEKGAGVVTGTGTGEGGATGEREEGKGGEFGRVSTAPLSMFEVKIENHSHSKADQICCEHLFVMTPSFPSSRSSDISWSRWRCQVCQRGSSKFLTKRFQCDGPCGCHCCGDCYERAIQRLSEITLGSGSFPVIHHSTTSVSDTFQCREATAATSSSSSPSSEFESEWEDL
jgi:hypothetical protein